MKKMYFMVIVMLFAMQSFAQKIDLSKMDEKSRNEYLINKAHEVTKAFGPEYYRPNAIGVISEVQIYAMPERDIKNAKDWELSNLGRNFYIVKFPTRELLYNRFTSKVEIWEDDGQPKEVQIGCSDLSVEFMSQPYNEWLEEGIPDYYIPEYHQNEWYLQLVEEGKVVLDSLGLMPEDYFKNLGYDIYKFTDFELPYRDR